MNQVIDSYFLELARLITDNVSIEALKKNYQEPPCLLNTINSSEGFLVVAPDKLSIKYTGASLHGHDVGVVQADEPATVDQDISYFEIYVKDAGAKGQIAIGFTRKGFNMRRQPGWDVNSYGYHGDDGFLYSGEGKGDEFGPTFTTGDTVGAGIDFYSRQFFFTKNGKLVGTVSNGNRSKCHLFPTIAVHSQNEEVHVNFGKKEYVFDISEYYAKECVKSIKSISLPPNICHGLVHSYLLHYGYEDTLNSFDLAMESTIPPINIAQENGFDEQDIVYALKERKIIRQLIWNGEIDAAITKIREWYPQIIQDDRSATWFFLHCQKFIELIRVEDLEAAVTCGRTELANFISLAKFDELVKDCFALLAYEHPQESSVGFLLKESRRDFVADTVNAMILSTNPNMNDVQDCLQSYLERFQRQLNACILVVWELGW